MGAPAVPLHDWTRVSAGKWHHMHLLWTGALAAEMNDGVLPEPFFALAEPATGFTIGPGGGDDGGGGDEPETWRREPDVLAAVGRAALAGRAAGNGAAHFARPDVGVATAEARSRFGLVEHVDDRARRRRVTVRHPDGDRVVAIIEFASPGNRDAHDKVLRFCRTFTAALRAGIHAVLVDPFPPTGPAPGGLHGAVWAELNGEHRPDPARPLTFAGYCVHAPGGDVTAAVERRAVGGPVPTVPLFLDPDWFLPLDLAPTYAAAFRGCPKPVREALGAAL